jgi:uncharacterized repeat protein (TIGR02543 family)
MDPVKFRTIPMLCVLLVCLAVLTISVGAAEEEETVSLLASTPTLDLANGSIVISQDSTGAILYTQGDTSQTGGSTCIVQQSNNATATTNTIAVESGDVTVTLTGVNIQTTDEFSAPISVQNGAALTLYLVGDSTVSATANAAAVQSTWDSTLVIQGSGSLTASGGSNGAGIGASNWGTVGTITINGGTITATGGTNGAGIGGGVNGNGGTIIINGGTVTATGGVCGAGIGGGYYGSSGIVTINGGTVTATGGSWAAGIGGGYRGAGDTITINGGAVTAIGSYVCSAIGGGYERAGGVVTITGGSVTAAGTSHAIGGGGISNLYGCDSITIGKNAVLDLSYNSSNGSTYQERIFDLDLADAAAASGNVPGLTTVANGASGVTYQWQTSQDGTTWSDIAGATGAACPTPVTASNDGWYFRCQVTNGLGNVAYTDAVRCYVLAFTKQPVGSTVQVNATVYLSVAVSCSKVTYQWERSYDKGKTWTDVPDSAYATLVLTATLGDSGALYRCVITAANGDQLASNTAQITVQAAGATYQIRDYLQNADGETYTLKNETEITVAAGKSLTAPETTYPGYTWDRSLDTTNDLVLSRYFTRNTYAITFDTQGGPALPDLEALYGAAVTQPADPSRYGYTFGGWYADAACTKVYTFTTMPLGGTTVYVKWISGDDGRSDNEYAITGILLRDSTSYEPVTGIPTGQLLAEVTVNNRTSTHADAVLLATYDKNGKMLKLSYLYAGVPTGTTFTLGMSVDNSSGNVASIKAFVLTSLVGAQPLATAVTYD